MILKSQVEWALHCCAILAGLPAGRYLSTKVLAEFHGVPKEYLSKALQAVSQASLVDATLGPNGGYRLARPAEDITFLDIVEAVEGGDRTFVCTNIRENNPCRPTDHCDENHCAVARVMWQADEAWRSSLRNVRLSDLMHMLNSEIPPELLSSSAQWVMKRMG